jgi:hypothetical protein
MQIELHEVQGFWPAIWGMRNPMQSHHMSDSEPPEEADFAIHEDEDGFVNGEWEPPMSFRFGSDDHSLAMKLANAGTDHGKFLRQIVVWVDITATQTWWSEFDTYRMGVEKNSTSKMHRLMKEEIKPDMFDFSEWEVDESTIEGLVNLCEDLRFEGEFDKLLQVLPMSFLQTRTCMISYAALRNMYHARRNHKLKEWQTFCDWIETLEYSELITGKEKEND